MQQFDNILKNFINGNKKDFHSKALDYGIFQFLYELNTIEGGSSYLSSILSYLKEVE